MLAKVKGSVPEHTVYTVVSFCDDKFFEVPSFYWLHNRYNGSTKVFADFNFCLTNVTGIKMHAKLNMFAVYYAIVIHEFY